MLSRSTIGSLGGAPTQAGNLCDNWCRSVIRIRHWSASDVDSVRCRRRSLSKLWTYKGAEHADSYHPNLNWNL